MTSRMDNKLQGGCNKTIFSIRSGQTGDKTNTNHEGRSRADGTRENEGISLQVQPKGRREMDHLLFHCKKTSTQREVLKHQLSQQRNWMEIKQELLSKHTKVFCEFIESIDFELLQQNEQ